MSGNSKRPPTSLPEALRLCKDHARARKNLSVERIAELMGVTADLLYKWLGTGRMPAAVLPGFEHICGAHHASRYLAISGGGLVIDIPHGRAVKPIDVHALQALLNDATGAILAFADGQLSAAQALAMIEDGMAGLAWHHENIGKAAQPELDL